MTLTVHEASSARKVDFHFWIDVLPRRGDQVDFVTVGMSLLTKPKPQAHQQHADACIAPDFATCSDHISGYVPVRGAASSQPLDAH